MIRQAFLRLARFPPLYKPCTLELLIRCHPVGQELSLNLTQATRSATREHFLKGIVLQLHYNPYLKSFSLISLFFYPLFFFPFIPRLLLICDYAFYHTKTEIFIPVKNNHPVITVTNCPSCIIVAISTNDIVLECLAIDFKWKI